MAINSLGPIFGFERLSPARYHCLFPIRPSNLLPVNLHLQPCAEVSPKGFHFIALFFHILVLVRKAIGCAIKVVACALSLVVGATLALLGLAGKLLGF